MAKKLAGVGLRGKSAKRAAEHPEDDEDTAKAQDEDNDEQNVKAQDEDEDETAKSKSKKAKSKAQDEEDEKEAQDEEDFERAQDEDEEEETAKSKSARREAKAVAQAKKSARLGAAAINDLCVLAGKPELAGGFIASGMSQAAVRHELLGARADGSSVGEIAGHTSPAGSPAATAAMWDHACKKNARFFGHA